MGYGKCGSFEGFASGRRGIAQLARFKVSEKQQMGESVAVPRDSSTRSARIRSRWPLPRAIGWRSKSTGFRRLTSDGDWRWSIDLLNPEVIVIGSIYVRNRELMEPFVLQEIEREALSHARRVCSVRPAKLGEQIGDYAALSVAANLI